MDLVVDRCYWCGQWPCVCRLRWVTKRCACGGTVRADPADPTLGVRMHQETERHRRWGSRTYG